MTLQFSHRDADVFQPAGQRLPPETALARTTHLCIAAHQDDIEIMAHHGIAGCYGRADKAFTGVVVTNGAGAPRAGPYAKFTDEQMLAVRRAEQRRAAELGRYNLMIQLGHSSSDVKAARNRNVFHDLSALFVGCKPEMLYLHQPADKHDTHIAVLLRCIEVLRSLPKTQRPRRVVGCEVWRDLDWLVDSDKVALDASGLPELAPQLLKVCESQVAGGKRYDLAALGRRAANATFHTSHRTDQTDAVTFAMDLTPLVENDGLSVAEFALAHLDRLRADVAARIAKFE
jgi:LmbE family N-acetylglucosaminyl deacetylase